jgi:hypothetical protein
MRNSRESAADNLFGVLFGTALMVFDFDLVFILYSSRGIAVNFHFIRFRPSVFEAAIVF